MAGPLKKLATWATGAKAISTDQVRHAGRSLVWFDFVTPPETATMAAEVGDGTSSDVLMSPIRWLQRSMMEAPLTEVDSEGAPTNGDLQKLFDQPNPFYALEHLLAGTVFSLSLDGNAYWLPARNANGRIVELWWMPHTSVEPKWPSDGAEFISHYEYRAGNQTQTLAVEDVIHFRDGLDPQNVRKGLSPVKGLLREVWSDQEAAVFSASLMRNGGVPGVVVSPKTDEFEIGPEAAEGIKAKIEATTGGGRGRTIVLDGPVTVEQFGFSPSQLDLGPLRNISEERICAALGTPAAVVGFGAGLQQTKVGATMRELRQLAWWNGVIPTQRVIESEIDRKLAPMVGAIGADFDRSEVEALRENEDARAGRVDRLYRAGIITRAEARTEVELDAAPADDVYVVSIGQTLVPQGQAANGDEPKAGRKDHTLLERRIVESAPQVDPPPAVRRFVRSMDRIRDEQGPAIFEGLVAPVFRALGRRSQAVIEAALREERSAPLGWPHRIALTKQDSLIGETILAGLDIVSIQRNLQTAYETGYGEISSIVAGELSKALGFTVEITDPVQLEILRVGGTRSGLVDLEQQSKDAIFQALEDGRAEGLAGSNLARSIRDKVEAGPWSTSDIRARVIARTEGAFAANTASVEMARSMDGTELMMMHDNRSGFDDELCPEIDGRVVTIDEAAALIADEHPNGTRGATPIPPLLAEEMGL